METKLFAVLDKKNIVIHAFLFNPQLFENIEPGETVPPNLDDLLTNYPECTLQEYNGGITVNEASIGYTYNSTLKAFIPPQSDPTYILNTETFEWEPDPTLEYDLHGDGKKYRYIPENKCWIPLW